MHSGATGGLFRFFRMPFVYRILTVHGAVQFGFPQTQVIEPCFAVLETVFFTPGTHGDVVTDMLVGIGT